MQYKAQVPREKLKEWMLVTSRRIDILTTPLMYVIFINDGIQWCWQITMHALKLIIMFPRVLLYWVFSSNVKILLEVVDIFYFISYWHWSEQIENPLEELVEDMLGDCYFEVPGLLFLLLLLFQPLCCCSHLLLQGEWEIQVQWLSPSTTPKTKTRI